MIHASNKSPFRLYQIKVKKKNNSQQFSSYSLGTYRNQAQGLGQPKRGWDVEAQRTDTCPGSFESFEFVFILKSNVLETVRRWEDCFLFTNVYMNVICFSRNAQLES